MKFLLASSALAIKVNRSFRTNSESYGVFEKCDQNHNGLLNTTEAYDCIKSANLSASVSNWTKKAFTKLANGTGQINYKKFRTIFKAVQRYQKYRKNRSRAMKNHARINRRYHRHR